MPKLLRAIILILLFTTFIPALAVDDSNLSDYEISRPPIMEQDESDSATVRVIPGEAVPGSQHVVLVTGLESNEEVSIRIIYENNNDVVYDALETASERGIIELDIFTETDDTPGSYRVEIVNGSGLVIGSDSLTIDEPEEYNAVVAITPLEAEAGAIFTIDISDVRPFIVLEAIVENENGDEIFSRRLRASVDGTALIEFESSIENSGILNIRVIEDEILEIASQEVIVSQAFTATIIIVPSEVLPGETVGATISGLSSDTDLIVEIALDNVIVTSIEASANSNGIAFISYDIEADATRGSYQFRIFQNGEQVGLQAFLVDILPVTVEIIPAIVPRGEVFVAKVSDLRAGEEIVVEFILGDDLLQSETSHADAFGIARAVFGQGLELEIGLYDIRVLRLGEEILVETVTVADETADVADTSESVDIIASIDPGTATIPGIYTLTVDGLSADTALDIAILFEGETLATFPGTVDENGDYSTQIGTDENDEPGIYTIEVSVDGEIIATVDLEATDEVLDVGNTDNDADADGQTETVIAGDVMLSISPEILLRGERIEFIASNLEPDESVTFELYFEGQLIYSTTATVDATGATATALLARDDEAFGDYEMRVVREGDIIASNRFEIVADDADRNNAQISIMPESGVRGTDFIIIVTGLEANENVDLSVSFADDVIFETTGTANADGTATIRLNSNQDDEIGTYAVAIIRENDDVVDASFTILEGEMELPDSNEDETDENTGEISDSSLEIAIDKNEVDEEESFLVLVSGLSSGEEISIEVEYDGEIVFETERIADGSGEVEISLRTFPGDPTGTYTIIAGRGDERVSAEVEVLADEDISDTTIGDNVNILVDPIMSIIGSDIEFTISGLDSGEIFDILVEFGNETVFETTRTADASGFFSITLDTNESDEAGTYTFSVIRADESIATIEFEVVLSITSTENDASTNDTANENDDTLDNETQSTAITSIVYADAVSIEFDADTSVQIVEFDAQAGDVINVTVDSGNSLDTVATLISPDGQIIASDDDGGQGFDPEIERVVLPDAGIYSLEIRSFTAGDSGSALVTINRNDGRSLTDVETRTVVLNSKITTDVLTFFAQAGDVISLGIDLESGSIGELHITAEQGEAILMDYSTSGLPGTIILGFVVPETGNIVIRLESDGTSDAILNTSVERE